MSGGRSLPPLAPPPKPPGGDSGGGGGGGEGGAPEAARLFSPAAERNTAPVLAELRRVLPPTGTLLEVASGTGQHAAAFAAALPGWAWWPSDLDPAARASVPAWCAGLANVQLPPLALDVSQPLWPGVPAVLDAIYSANLIHIAPWAVCEGLLAGAGRHLRPGGLLLTYGPYLEDELPTAPSNQAVDADLRARNPAWGIRRRADVEAAAAPHGLRLAERVAMPANNLLLVWRRG